MAKPNAMLEAAAKAAGVDLEDSKGLDEDEFFSDPDEEEVEEELEAIENGEESSEPPETSTSDDEDEVPDTYFGVNLAAIEDEDVRLQTYNQLQEANRAANRRLQELAELRKQEEEERRKVRPDRVQPQTEEEPADLSDEELLELAGINTELLQYEDFGKPVAQLVKLVLDTQNKLEDFTKQSANQAWEQEFYTKFDKLQDEYGELPYDKGTIEEYAIERGVFDPEALYWVMAGPVARQAATPVKSTDSKEMRKIKKAVSGTKRRGSAKGSTTPGKPKTMKEAYELAKQQHKVPDGSDPFAD